MYPQLNKRFKKICCFFTIFTKFIKSVVENGHIFLVGLIKNSKKKSWTWKFRHNYLENLELEKLKIYEFLNLNWYRVATNSE